VVVAHKEGDRDADAALLRPWDEVVPLVLKAPGVEAVLVGGDPQGQVAKVSEGEEALEGLAAPVEEEEEEGLLATSSSLLTPLPSLTLDCQMSISS
jgi:hypothetical protein